MLLVFGCRSAGTPCPTPVLEDESIKDVTCDSDGAQELCLDHTKGSIPPLDHLKAPPKNPLKIHLSSSREEVVLLGFGFVH